MPHQTVNVVQDVEVLEYTPGVKASHTNEKHNPKSANLHPDLELAFTYLVSYLQRGRVTPSEEANFSDTAIRAAKAFRDLTASREEITARLHEILETGFPREPQRGPVAVAHGMVTQGPIQVFSLCPHHLLQVEYECHVAYIPSKEDGNVLGLSKLARIAQTLGKRPILQEQLASDIADVLYAQQDASTTAFPAMRSQGSAVHLIGRHSCMCCRGVQSNALTSVAEMRGVFWEGQLEQKFYQNIAALNASRLLR